MLDERQFLRAVRGCQHEILAIYRLELGLWKGFPDGAPYAVGDGPVEVKRRIGLQTEHAHLSREADAIKEGNQMRAVLAHVDLLGLKPLFVASQTRLHVVGYGHRGKRKHHRWLIALEHHDRSKPIIGEIAVG
ncbi:hypothetical protein D3C85_996760 [compost metagenome]